MKETGNVSEQGLADMHDEIVALATSFRERGFELLAVPLYAIALYMASGQLHKFVDSLGPGLRAFAMLFEMMHTRPEHQALRDFDVLLGHQPNEAALYSTNPGDAVASGLRPAEPKAEPSPAEAMSDEWQVVLNEVEV